MATIRVRWTIRTVTTVRTVRRIVRTPVRRICR